MIINVQMENTEWASIVEIITNAPVPYRVTSPLIAKLWPQLQAGNGLGGGSHEVPKVGDPGTGDSHRAP